MLELSFRRLSLWLGVAAMAAVGCAESGPDDGPGTGEGPVPEQSEAPLSDLDSLLEGAPDPSKLPDEPKADGIHPKQFDLVDVQSPVKSQGSRGVCSIFSTVALMEHLYIKEGTLRNPDFSEQFLQWSVKFEVASFRNTSGSNADRNIEAISRFGVVDEATMPYETFEWGVSQDSRCSGDDRPTECYTNGHPSYEIKSDARRWKLPRARWVSNQRRNIKAYIYQNKQAVVGGMQFFYQSWNHRTSTLKTNNEYWRQGYVLFPNAKDDELSTARRAGHSILIVGWDDDLEVPTVDENGDVVTDADGNPVMERGFFLIKNSWGTSGFGIDNPFGAGYGWLSMRYVERYASLNGSDIPLLDLGPEICDDGVDNNFDGVTDCEDEATCGTHPACRPDENEHTYRAGPAATIPDNDSAGVQSTINVVADGVATSVVVELDIAHSFPRDLKVVLVAPDGSEATLRAQQSGAETELTGARLEVPALIGVDAAGTWTLRVFDLSVGDVGTLNAWTLRLGVAGSVPAEICDDGIDNVGNGLVDCADPACADDAACTAPGTDTLSGLSEDDQAIPDQNTDGVRSVISLQGAGTVTDVSIDVDIEHTYRGDLTITLIHPDGTSAVLLNKEGGSTPNVQQTFTTQAFNGRAAAGEWTLWVVDSLAGDVGTLRTWMLEVGVR